MKYERQRRRTWAARIECARTMTGVTGDVLVPRPSSPFVLLPKANTLPWGSEQAREGKVLGEDRTRHTQERTNVPLW